MSKVKYITYIINDRMLMKIYDVFKNVFFGYVKAMHDAKQGFLYKEALKLALEKEAGGSIIYEDKGENNHFVRYELEDGDVYTVFHSGNDPLEDIQFTYPAYSALVHIFNMICNDIETSYVSIEHTADKCYVFKRDYYIFYKSSVFSTEEIEYYKKISDTRYVRLKSILNILNEEYNMNNLLTLLNPSYENVYVTLTNTCELIKVIVEIDGESIELTYDEILKLNIPDPSMFKHINVDVNSIIDNLKSNPLRFYV